MKKELWMRKCQECGHSQEDKHPEGAPTEAYLNRKCKRCKSMGLDFGKWVADDYNK